MQLQRNLDRFDAAGIAVFAISNDPVDAQSVFAHEYGITYPLLADPDHAVIEAVGILNTLIEPDEPLFGIPYPGSYLVAADGTIEEKLFFANYRSRPAASTVLRDGFGVDLAVPSDPRVEIDGSGVRISVELATDTMVFAQIATLHVNIELDDGLHIYAPPTPLGYTALEVSISAPERVRVDPPRYPPTRPFRIVTLDDHFVVFEPGPIHVTAQISNGLPDATSFPLDVTVTYQACTDRECLLPQHHTLHLDVPVEPLISRIP